MNLFNFLCETVDFYYEFEEKNSCEFSDSLRKNRSKLYKFITNLTIAQAASKLFVKSILDQFVIIKKITF
jgi:hypothetical protein